MIYDANLKYLDLDNIQADIVIVGAGTIGIFLASYLLSLNDKLNLILVEAGGEIASAALDVGAIECKGKKHSGYSIGRASGLGGTSTLWGGQLAEFDRQDLEGLDASWPISFEELKSYYDLVYVFLDIKRENPEHTKALFGGELAPNPKIERFFTHWLKEPNFSRLYKKIINSKNTKFLINLTANRINFNEKTAKSIGCKNANGNNINIHFKKIIFSAGTISTNRFFLSTKECKNVPWSNNENIGCYFQDHLGGKIADVEIYNEKLFREYFENAIVNGIKIQPKLKFSDIERENLVSGACAFFGFNSSLSESIDNIKHLIRMFRANLFLSRKKSIFQDLFTLSKLILPIIIRYCKDRRILAVFDRGVFLQVQAEQIPLKFSQITIDRGQIYKDGLNRIKLEWLCDGREIFSISKLAKNINDYLVDKEIGRLHIKSELLSMDPMFVNSLNDTYHQCGGMRMSLDSSDGVVNKNCLVWGTDNVWVADASIFPSSSHANCTLTALALSARLAKELVSI